MKWEPGFDSKGNMAEVSMMDDGKQWQDISAMQKGKFRNVEVGDVVKVDAGLSTKFGLNKGVKWLYDKVSGKRSPFYVLTDTNGLKECLVVGVEEASSQSGVKVKVDVYDAWFDSDWIVEVVAKTEDRRVCKECGNGFYALEGDKSGLCGLCGMRELGELLF